MADSTAPLTRTRSEDPSRIAVQIADAVALYHHTFAGVRGPTHATSQGYADSYDDEAGMIFAGLVETPGGLASATGDTGADPPTETSISILPQILRSVTVTGATAQTDLFRPVYATDNQTLDLARPADDAEVVGVVVKWHTSTTCDVLLLGLAVQIAVGFAGGNRQVIELGHFDHAALTTGDKVTDLPMPFHGKFVSLHGAVETAFTGSAGTAALNLEIGTTNVTGGVLTVSTAAGGTIGTVLNGTAITAENVFHEGDLISLEAVGSGTQTAGRVRVFAIVERLPGC